MNEGSFKGLEKEPQKLGLEVQNLLFQFLSVKLLQLQQLSLILQQRDTAEVFSVRAKDCKMRTDGKVCPGPVLALRLT